MNKVLTSQGVDEFGTRYQLLCARHGDLYTLQKAKGLGITTRWTRHRLPMESKPQQSG